MRKEGKRKMKNRSLVTQFRLAFAWIVIASITATAITYALAAVIYVKAQYKSIYPANYYEKQIPDIDAYIREKNTTLLLQSGEEGLQRTINGNGIYYQVLDGDGNFYTERMMKKSLNDKSELYSRLNTTIKKQNYYIHTVPIIDDNGKVLVQSLSYTS